MRVGVPHAAGRAGRALDDGRAAVDGELRFAVEDDEHLLALIMEVRADAALRLNDAAVQEVQIGFEAVGVEQAPCSPTGRRRRGPL